MTHLLGESAVYNALSAHLRSMLLRQGAGIGLRAWVAGCARGQDAYAAALLLHELAAGIESVPTFTVFATETDLEQLLAARTGVFSEAQLAELSPEQRDRFFLLNADEYQVEANLREQVIFAAHDLLQDPPFSRLSLIICRNLYNTLSTPQRVQALERFAFALQPHGVLLLEDATSIEDDDQRFQWLDPDYPIYARTNTPWHPSPFLAVPPPSIEPAPDRRVLAPDVDTRHATLIVDEQLQIVYLGLHAAPFLRMTPGAPSFALLDVIQPALRAVLSSTLGRARMRGRAAESVPVLLTLEGVPQQVTIVVQPLSTDHGIDGALWVIFDSSAPDERMIALAPEPRSASNQPGDILQLQAEHELLYEEVRVSNEELQITNEALISSIEELEVRREELQTVNEQLATVNAEQQKILMALTRSNSDLENLIVATDIGTLFLDRSLALQRYTAPAEQAFNLISTDLGRPLAHLTHQLYYDDLLEDVVRVLATLEPIEHEAHHADGRWFLVRVRPYRTTEQQVTGVVLSLIDISDRKRAEEALQRSHEELEQRVQERTIDLVQVNVARQRLLRELVTAQESERLRIARELHDTLGQQITAILLGLQRIKEQSYGRNAALAQIEQIWAIVQDMAREMHDIAVALRPTALDDVGLTGALRSYVESWSKRTAIDLDLFVNGVERNSLPPEIETTLYRVVQEALTNVARHSGAGRVGVVLECDDRRVVAVIEDDGRGFDGDIVIDASQREHLGILGIQERVALVGGTVTIDSELGQGTTLIARIPLPKQEGVSRGSDPSDDRG